MIGSPMLVRQLVWSEKDFMYICYQPCWEGYLCAARPGGFCKELKQHITINVSMPLAISLCCSSEVHSRQEIERGNIGLPHSVWTTWSGSKEGCRGSCLSLGWDAPELDGLSFSLLWWMHHQHLNDCLELTHLHQANADFVKVYESGYSSEVKAKSTMRLFIDQDGEKFSHPNCWLRKTGLFETFLEGLCLICRSNEHSAESCKRVSLLPESTYDHGGVNIHSLQICPNLRHFCRLLHAWPK